MTVSACERISFDRVLADEPFILFEGAVIERLRRDGQVQLDPHLLHAAFVYSPPQRQALAGIYRSYLDIGCRCQLPMAVLTPTWRANPERTARWAAACGSAGSNDPARLNRDGLAFMADLRAAYGLYARRVSIGGLMGCRGDAYHPQEALSIAEARRFHALQAESLADADFLLASTLPALSEAWGMAQAMAAAGRSYLLSFVVRPGGTLLDGTPLERAVEQIDAGVDPAPAAYMANCVHPAIFAQALRATFQRAPQVQGRIVGLQANTSPKPPEELDNAAELESEAPEPFAAAMARVHVEWGIRALGGCCGTDHRHIEAVARHVTRMAAAGACPAVAGPP